MKKILFIKLCFCFLLNAFGSLTFAQETSTDFLKIQIEKDKVNAKTISTVISAITTKYKIPIGLEIKSKEKVEKITNRVSLLKKSGTLEEILNQLTNKFSGYSWKVNGGVVNIFPSKNRDILLQEVLDVKVSELKFEFGSDKMDIGRSIFKIPEVDNFLQSKKIISIQINDISGITYKNLEDLEAETDKNLTIFDFKNTSVIGILNTLLSKGTINYWVISRWHYDEKSPISIITK